MGAAHSSQSPWRVQHMCCERNEVASVSMLVECPVVGPVSQQDLEAQVRKRGSDLCKQLGRTFAEIYGEQIRELRPTLRDISKDIQQEVVPVLCVCVVVALEGILCHP